MAYNIVLTTAEDIVAVVDAIVAKGSSCKIDFILEFTGIATNEQVDKALRMAIELELLEHNPVSGEYTLKSYWGKYLVTSSTDREKAIIMRLILDQYEPYISFKTRYKFTKSIDIACRQVKVLYNMTSNERDIKNTLVSIATYSKALISEGANLYRFSDDDNDLSLVDSVLTNCSLCTTSLQLFWGESLYSFIDHVNITEPLTNAIQKTKESPMDCRAVIVYAANAFESFLDFFANHKSVSIAGKNGIIQKSGALSSVLSKKHRGMIEFIGQVRNAADHGADADEGNQTWSISTETACIYPFIVAIVIKDIYQRDIGTIQI